MPLDTAPVAGRCGVASYRPTTAAGGGWFVRDLGPANRGPFSVPRAGQEGRSWTRTRWAVSKPDRRSDSEVSIEMRALVVYESMFGNTSAVATAIATGLSTRMGVDLVEVAAAPAALDAGVDLVVAGGPTHAFSMSRPN